MMKRREFLETAAAGLVGLSLPRPLFSGPSRRRAGERKRPVLVVVYLRGGLDPLNTIVPYGEARYYELRPTIAIPAPGQDQGGVIALDDKFGLHPALADLEPLWNEGLFVPILNVGSPHPTRSHFDAQDFMEYAAPGLRTLKAGWLNRYLSATRSESGAEPELRAVGLQGLLPRALRGSYPVLAAPPGQDRRTSEVLEFYDDLYLGGGGMEPLPEAGPEARPESRMESGSTAERDGQDAVLQTGQATIRALRRYLEIMKAGESRERAAYPAGQLGPKLRAIATLIRHHPDLEVACVDWNGWDHHAGQGGLEGLQARLLAHLGQSLKALMEDLGAHRKRTLVLVMTEFGRTCRENGNAGTDHGHGGLMLALGGALKGRKIHGRWEGLADNDLYEGRDLPVTTDFRDVFNEVLTTHMEFEPDRAFFPEYRPGRGPGFLV